jgi:hypothetical protein
MKKWMLLPVLLGLAGCASEVVRYPAELTAVGQQQKRYTTSQSVPLRFDSGYDRTIMAGTGFVEAGTIKQGTVLKPTNTVLTVEGMHMHEAYLVVQGGRIVGFYLPADRAFAPVTQPVPITLQERNP